MSEAKWHWAVRPGTGNPVPGWNIEMATFAPNGEGVVKGRIVGWFHLREDADKAVALERRLAAAEEALRDMIELEEADDNIAPSRIRSILANARAALAPQDQP